MKSEPHAEIVMAPSSAEIRCGCGSLIARKIKGGIEIKCRRCHSRVLLRLTPDGELEVLRLGDEP